MKSFLFVVFSLFFISAVIGAAEDWEGVYEWTGLGSTEASLCYEDGWVFGTAGHILAFAARVDGDAATGNWWGAGFKQGSHKAWKNWPTTGWFKAELTAAGEVSAHISYRGHKNRWYDIELGSRLTETVPNRIVDCGIMDRASVETVAGEWHEQASVHTKNTHASYCIDGKAFEGSYTLTENSTDGNATGTGYNWGKCNWGGKICRSDWFEAPYFGVEVERILSDGTLGTFWWQGPTAFLNVNSTGQHYVSDRLSETATTAQCAANVLRHINPNKCRSFDSETCIANPYYCTYRQSGGQCRRIKKP